MEGLKGKEEKEHVLLKEKEKKENEMGYEGEWRAIRRMRNGG